MKAYGFIHTHSEYSLKDAPLKLADIVKEAKKMGATAIALTDHGTAAGWIEFYDLCKNEGIKPILGVEAYIRSETNSRTHLILLAKNYTGYKEISQAISDSNENIERIADMDIPIMTKEILQKYLHGDNVIVTSACVSGVLSEILLSRKKIQEQVDSIKKKMDDYYSPYDTGYLKNKELVSSLDTEIAELTAKKEKLEIIAKRNFREQKKSLSMDFLGLKNLDIMTNSIRLIYKRKGISIDLSNLPFEDVVFKEIFAKGNTGCVFQFESGGMKQMLVKFGPESFEDIILLVASYRPGPMQYIPDMIEIKHKRKKAEYIIPQLEDILGKTYGQCIYQEQLMDIFHKCAGFSLGKADLIRRFMSKKKEELFLKEKEPFLEGIIKKGASRKDAEKYWNELVEFAKYAFNKSHAAAYAVISYQTAYLKYHYPIEYMCGVLICAKIEKLPVYLYECKKCNVQVEAPDINLSEEDFFIKNNKIYFGLSKIKGVGEAGKIIIEERKNGKFVSFADFLLRVNIDIGKIRALIQTGCFDKLENDKRSYLLSSSEYMNKLARSITKKNDELNLLEKEQKKKIENLKITIDSLQSEYNKIAEHGNDIVLKDKLDFLREEKELLGTYISGHPLDKYKKLFYKKNITFINDVEKGKYSCIGCIQNVRYTKRKSDGAKMAFFTLEDLSGSIEVNCFAKEFAQFKDLIMEDNVVEIYGYIHEEQDYFDEEKRSFKLTAKKIKKCYETDGYILLSTACQRSYKIYTFPFIENYLCEDGKSVVLHNEQTGRVGLSNLRLNKEIISIFDSLTPEEKPKDTWVQSVNI